MARYMRVVYNFACCVRLCCLSQHHHFDESRPVHRITRAKLTKLQLASLFLNDPALSFRASVELLRKAVVAIIVLI